MDQFEAARLKNEKRLAAMARSKAKKPPEQKEAPKEVKVSRGPQPMMMHISGPVEMTLEVHYAGTLLSSQVTEAGLRSLLKKCLLPIGRVL